MTRTSGAVGGRGRIGPSYPIVNYHDRTTRRCTPFGNSFKNIGWLDIALLARIVLFDQNNGPNPLFFPNVQLAGFKFKTAEKSKPCCPMNSCQYEYVYGT